MMRVPGRKESGVIFTTVTEPPPNERLERSERERPSGSGLERSKDETTRFRASRLRSKREKKTRGGERGGKKRQKREWRYQKTLKNSGKIKS